MQQYACSEVLVTHEWMDEHLDASSVVVVEVNTDLKAGYHQGHVPGAVGWGLHTDLEDPTRRDIPGVGQMEALLERSGIGNDTTVVLYGDGNNRSATWAFWIMKYYRHRDVRLINGGRVKWLDSGMPVSTEVPTCDYKSYRIKAPDRRLRVMKDYIAENLGDSSIKLLDTRTYQEYAGRVAASPDSGQGNVYRKGRIPGAIHVPWEDSAMQDGTFRAVEELSALYAGKGLEPTNEVISYCRLGVRASYSWFVLKYLLGYPRVRNYDGSWTEWGNAVGVPIDTDVGPGTKYQ